MATDVVPTESPTNTSPAPPAPRERTAEQIITAARTAPPSSLFAWGLSLVFGLLLWASFPPLDVGPLGFLALVPLLMLVRTEQRPWWTYPASYVGGLLGYLALFQWMRLGDPTMYVAWVAVSVYVAAYVPLFVWLCRTAVLRYRVPLVLAAPVLWTGLEFLRSHLLTGCPWYLLGHTSYRWLELLQIADVTGALGVTFLVVLSSALLASLVPSGVYAALRLVPADVDAGFAVRTPSPTASWIAVGATIAVFAATLTYGFVRRSQATWTKEDAKPGPRVALVQGNFPASVGAYSPQQVTAIKRTHWRLMGLAMKHATTTGERPDLFVWPEAMFPYPPVLEVDPNVTDERLAELTPDVPAEWWRQADARFELERFAAQSNAAVVVGVNAYVAEPDKVANFNSAAFVHPSTGYAGRYDKMHRVPFGEYVPLKDELPFLASFTPYGFGFGIEEGDRPWAFEYGEWRIAPVICFESTVPGLVRRVVRETEKDGRPVDLLVTLSNDGWFHGSAGLDQHLVTSAFRCVETRTPMACAVNTGISAFIDGDGAIVEPDLFLDADGKGRKTSTDATTGRWHRQLNALVQHEVPLDGRTSLYVRYGDWFGIACLASVLFAVMAALVPRRKTAVA